MYWFVLVCTRYVPVCTGMYLYVLLLNTLLAGILVFFGNHIIPAVLYRYTQVLLRPDLMNSKGKPLVTTALLEAVWKRLSDRFSTVVEDTSMITMSTEYAAHVHAIFIDGKEHAKMTAQAHASLSAQAHASLSSLHGSRPRRSRGNMCSNIHVHTSTYKYVPVRTSMCLSVPVHTGTFRHIPVCTSQGHSLGHTPEPISPQVRSCMYWYIPVSKWYKPVHTSTYQFVLHYNLYILVFARLRSSMRLLIKPRKDLICTGYHMLQILVTRFKRFL